MGDKIEQMLIWLAQNLEKARINEIFQYMPKLRIMTIFGKPFLFWLLVNKMKSGQKDTRNCQR